MATKIKVIAIGRWIHSQNNASEGGLISQVTYCQLDGIPFYVRENINGIDSFYIASNERQGDKAGRKPSMSRQVLEVLVPNIAWEKVRDAIIQTDTLKRPVRRSRNFTKEFLREIKLHEL